jgi:WD40 repeat protein
MASAGGGQTTPTTAKDKSFSTENIQTAHSTSSAEYIVGEIRRHKKGVALALVSLALVAALAFGWYRFAQRGAMKPASQAMKITRLTSTGKASDAAISPDGKYVVHVMDDGGQQSLWVRQVATQSNVQIVPPASSWFQGLTFTPDGNYIYYVMISNDVPQRALYQVPVLGGAPKKLLVNLLDEPITFSPDGKRFAFARRDAGKEDALMIANADGSAER